MIIAMITQKVSSQNPVVSRTNNECYQCLYNNSWFCSFENTTVCCPPDDTSVACKQGVCVSPYDGPKYTVPKNNYTLTHNATSSYDPFLNFFICSKYVDNPCTDPDELIIPSIGHFRSHLIFN